MTERAKEHAPHTPKVAALRAEAAGLLSGAGRARLLKHVETCEVCAEHLRGARRFHALVSRATGQPVVDEAGSVQRALVRNRLAQRRSRMQWGGVAAAAGVALAVFLASRAGREGAELAAPEAPAASPAPASAPEPAPSEPLVIAVTALRGTVHLVEPARPDRIVSIDDTLGEHSALRVADGAAIDLELGAVARVHLAERSELALEAARSARVALRLIRGEVSSAVVKRAAHESYEILAAGHRIAVRGTVFAVRAGGPSGVAVRCDEGSVEVIGPDGKSTLLTAPATWNERVIGPAGAEPEPPLELERPYAAQGGAVLTLPVLAGVEAWEVQGQAVPATAGLRMRVPPGRLDLVAVLAGGKRQPVALDIDALGAEVTPADLPFLKTPAPSRPAGPEPAAPGAQGPDPAEVIQAGRPALQRCYERSLKNESSGSHALRLSISIDPRGRVRKVEPSAQQAGTPLPAELDQCIRAAVSTWRFAAPGGDGVTLEAPLRFSLRR